MIPLPAWIELAWTLAPLTPFLAVIYLVDRAGASHRVRQSANDNLSRR